MWTLKIHVTRIHLEEHSRRCDTAHDGGFALQNTFFGALQRRASPENLPYNHKSRKTFDGPRSPVPRGECATLNAWMNAKYASQAAPLLWASVYEPRILRCECTHRPFWVAKNKCFGAPRTNGGCPRHGSDASGKFRWKSSPGEWDVRAPSDRVSLCRRPASVFRKKRCVCVMDLSLLWIDEAKAIKTYIWILFLLGGLDLVIDRKKHENFNHNSR